MCGPRPNGPLSNRTQIYLTDVEKKPHSPDAAIVLNGTYFSFAQADLIVPSPFPFSTVILADIERPGLGTYSIDFLGFIQSSFLIEGTGQNVSETTTPPTENASVTDDNTELQPSGITAIRSRGYSLRFIDAALENYSVGGVGVHVEDLTYAWFEDSLLKVGDSGTLILGDDASVQEFSNVYFVSGMGRTLYRYQGPEESYSVNEVNFYDGTCLAGNWQTIFDLNPGVENERVRCASINWLPSLSGFNVSEQITSIEGITQPPRKPCEVSEIPFHQLVSAQSGDGEGSLLTPLSGYNTATGYQLTDCPFELKGVRVYEPDFVYPFTSVTPSTASSTATSAIMPTSTVSVTTSNGIVNLPVTRVANNSGTSSSSDLTSTSSQSFPIPTSPGSGRGVTVPVEAGIGVGVVSAVFFILTIVLVIVLVIGAVTYNQLYGPPTPRRLSQKGCACRYVVKK
ncbi:MAG: hypothetical protein ACR2PX_14565 [Endozoicomonas sp.]|uniref:hypothetical protein n=1 Tax=Endozoicomonas sp. TaxID=1892382 RepID=UPI003D9BCAEF